MSRSFYTLADGPLLTGSLNFANLIVLDPTVYGLTVPQAAAYRAAHDVYSAAYHEAADPITRTRAKIADREDAKISLKQMARQLAAIIKSTPGVTDGQLINLGLSVPGERQPHPVPNAAAMTILSVVGRKVTARLFDPTEPTRRGLPRFVDGATIMSHVGDAPSGDVKAWRLEGNVAKAVFSTTFPATLPVGTQVWLTGFFFNERKLSGVASPPQSVYLGAGLSSAA